MLGGNKQAGTPALPALGKLGDAELLTGPAPTAFPQSCPNYQVASRQQEDNTGSPEQGHEHGDGQRGNHQDADDEKPEATLLDHLSATCLAFYDWHDHLARLRK